MAIWKEQPPRKDEFPVAPMAASRADVDDRGDVSAYGAARRPTDVRESVIAAELTIEGKIEGTGHVRIAGRFNGDVHVQGNLTIDPGARLTGGVRANTIVIGGELEGNITGAQRVELLESGVLQGDLKAGSLTVAAGSRMRGQVEFGWGDEKGAQKPAVVREASGSAA